MGLVTQTTCSKESGMKPFLKTWPEGDEYRRRRSIGSTDLKTQNINKMINIFIKIKTGLFHDKMLVILVFTSIMIIFTITCNFLYHSWSGWVISLPLRGQEMLSRICFKDPNKLKKKKNQRYKDTLNFFPRSNKFLSISSGIDDLGEPKYELALGLLFAWILCFLCLLKGIKTTGKVRGSWFSI